MNSETVLVEINTRPLNNMESSIIIDPSMLRMPGSICLSVLDFIFQPVSVNDYIYGTNQNNSFIFSDTTYHVFDCEKDNLASILKMIKNMEYNHKLCFEIRNGKDCAVGSGANKQVYDKLAQEIFGIKSSEESIMVTNSYFADINTNHYFWKSNDNIRNFVVLIAMIIDAGCLLPFHLAPGLLEKISNTQMIRSELDFYMDKIDTDSLHFSKKICTEDFHSLGTDFSTHEDYYRNTIIGTICPEKAAIYQAITNHLNVLLVNKFDILSLDNFFSGPYILTPNLVLPICKLNKEKYNPIWQNFLQTLNDNELKQMLMVFGNNISLKNTYFINITRECQTDIDISVCSSTICINKKIFENPEQLDKLKWYFANGDDKIKDYQLLNTTIDPQISLIHELSSLYPSCIRERPVVQCQNEAISSDSTDGTIYMVRQSSLSKKMDGPIDDMEILYRCFIHHDDVTRKIDNKKKINKNLFRRTNNFRYNNNKRYNKGYR